jgi:hypothetical protein
MNKKLEPIVRRAYQKAGMTDWETRPVWGRLAPRVRTKGFWSEALALNRRAGQVKPEDQIGAPRMFPSMIDWLDDMPAGIIDQDGQKLEPDAVRGEFLTTIHSTPSLNWLLLTKRPENFRTSVMTAGLHLAGHRDGQTGIMPSQPAIASEAIIESVLDWAMCEFKLPNVWLGFSAENREQLIKRWNVAKFWSTKVLMISIEPLLEDVSSELNHVLLDARCRNINVWPIIGGESGSDRRDCGTDAIVQAARVCQANAVRCFVKQASAFKPGQQGEIPDDVWALQQFPI